MTSGVVALTCGAQTKSGAACKKAPMVGLKRCRIHKGNANMGNHEREKLRRGMEKFVTPVDGADPEVNVVYGFEMELRRTLAAIRYYDEKIAELDEEQAFWGKTRTEDVNAGEFPGTNVTYEARMNAVMAARLEERKHLHALHKTWISAKLDERKIQATTALVDSLNGVITSVIVGLGQNPRDPEVRKVVRAAMLGITGGPAAITEGVPA